MAKQATKTAKASVREVRCKILTVAQQKGGVGKTTWTRILAEYFALIRKVRVLVIDLDPQCNLSQRFLQMERDPVADDGVIPPIHPDFDAAVDGAVWDGRSPITNIFLGRIVVPYTTYVPGIDILPGYGSQLQQVVKASESELKERIIKRLAEFLRSTEVQEAYDIILIDTPPSKNPLTEAALRASTQLMIPIEMEPQAAEGLVSMLNFWRAEQRLRSPGDPLTLVGMLPNKVRKVALHQGILQSLREHRVLAPYILPFDAAQRIAYAESDHAEAKPKSVLHLPERDETRAEAMLVCRHVEGEVFGNVTE